MKRILVGMAMALSLLAGTSALAAPAIAEEVNAADVHPLFWRHAAWAKTLDECIAIGESGRQGGIWRSYDCDFYASEPEPWEVYVDYI